MRRNHPLKFQQISVRRERNHGCGGAEWVRSDFNTQSCASGCGGAAGVKGARLDFQIKPAFFMLWV